MWKAWGSISTVVLQEKIILLMSIWIQAAVHIFVIQHQKESYSICRRARIANRWQKIILETYQRPQKFYQQKIGWVLADRSRQHGQNTQFRYVWVRWKDLTWNKLLPAKQKRYTLIHSDIYLQMVANGGIPSCSGKTPWILKRSVEFIIFPLKQSLSQSSRHVPVSFVEKEEWPWHTARVLSCPGALNSHPFLYQHK